MRKPILDALQTREDGIQNALDSAENAKLEMQNLQADNDKLLKEAMQFAESKQYKDHVKQLNMQITYVLLYYWRKYEMEAKKQHLKMPGTFETLFAEFEKNTQKYGVWQINRTTREKTLSKLKKYYYLDFSARASRCYGSKPEDAFDENLMTAWNGSASSGWLEIKFNKPKLVSSIHTIFNRKDIKVDYTLLRPTWHILKLTYKVLCNHLMVHHYLIFYLLLSQYNLLGLALKHR